MAAKKIALPVVTLAGEKVGEVKLSAEVFGLEEPNHQVVHDAVCTEQANRRQATAKTKKRHEVSGGGKKPWRQKGTGRARAGSIRSPLWVGGGTVFGPDGNQSYKRSQNKKAHVLALRSVLSDKVAGKGVIVVDELALEAVSTKALALALKAIGAEGRTLLVDDTEDPKLVLSSSNLAGVKCVSEDNIGVYDLLAADHLVISKKAIEALEGGLL